MAPVLIIAGVSIPVFNRNRTYSPAIPNWELKVIPSRAKKGADLGSCLSEVLAIADNAKEEGAHILGFARNSYDRKKVETKIHDKHRLVWLSPEALYEYGSAPFTKYVSRLAEFESQWRLALRPKGVNTPAILPETTFSPVNAKDMWGRIKTVVEGKDDLLRVSKLVSHFRSVHRKGKVWRDRNGLEFNPNGERHGYAERSMRWKLTFLVPEGFHFDVKNSRKKAAFVLNDINGNRHSFKVYTNVDCHGNIRAGK